MRTRFLLVGLAFFVLVGVGLSWLWWTTRPGTLSSITTTTTLPPIPPLLPSLPSPVPEPSESSEPSSESLDAAVPWAIGVIDGGTLMVEIRGQRVGTEDYTLERREGGELVLRSQGVLNFKIAFLSVQATFVQAITFTAQRRPLSYQLALDGPIGIGHRQVSASFGETMGIIHDGKRQVEIALTEEPFVLLGMFSSYAVLPLWAVRDTSQKLKVISLRGDRRDQGEVWMFLKYVGPVTLRGAQGTSREAEEYLLKGGRLTLKLYLSGERLLALQNDTQKRDESFRLFRYDLFSDGFDVLSRAQ